MSKIYRITLHDENEKQVFTWDQDAAKDALFKRYSGRPGYKVISNASDSSHGFYFAVYDGAPFDADENGRFGQLMANIHEIELQGRRIKL